MAVTAAHDERSARPVATFVTDAARAASKPGVLFSSLVAIAAFSRLAVAGGLSVLWADDGKFLQAVRAAPPWESILHVYNGYVNLAGMAIATALEPVPIEYTPAAYAAAWAAAVGALASYVATVSASFLDSIASRAALGASVGLIPVLGVESVGSIANLHWSMLASCTIALVAEPGSLRVRRVTVGLLALTALSSPPALALAPLIWWRRQRRAEAVAWSVAMYVQIMIAVFLGERESGLGNWHDFGRIMNTFVATSTNGVTTMWPDREAGLTPLSVLFVGLAVVAVVRNRDRVRLPAVLVAAALAQWCFTYAGGGGVAVVARYAIVPAICVLAFTLAASESHRALHVAVLFVVALAWIGEGAASDYRTDGKNWQDQVATETCEDGLLVFELAPPGWGGAIVPC